MLDRYQVSYLLLDTTGYHAELLPQVERSPLWQPVCQSGDSVLFGRRADVSEATALRK